MLRVILLICGMSTSPQACDQTTAYSVTPVGLASTNTACLEYGQTVSAAVALSDERVYSKIVCKRITH